MDSQKSLDIQVSRDPSIRIPHPYLELKKSGSIHGPEKTSLKKNMVTAIQKKEEAACPSLFLNNNDQRQRSCRCACGFQILVWTLVYGRDNLPPLVEIGLR